MTRLILVTAVSLAVSTLPALSDPGDAIRNTIGKWTTRVETVLRDPWPPVQTISRHQPDECTEGARGLTAKGSANCDYDTSGSQNDPDHRGMIEGNNGHLVKTSGRAL